MITFNLNKPTTDKPELQKRLQSALDLTDSDFSYHYSDLYVLDKPGVRDWLKNNYKFYSMIKTCRGTKKSQWQGQLFLDIPFAGKWIVNTQK